MIPTPFTVVGFTHADIVTAANPVGHDTLPPLRYCVVPFSDAAPTIFPAPAVAPLFPALFPFDVESPVVSKLPFPKCQTPL
jgi:hypothetical protein